MPCNVFKIKGFRYIGVVMYFIDCNRCNSRSGKLSKVKHCAAIYFDMNGYT
jgi:hypothetical protein